MLAQETCAHSKTRLTYKAENISDCWDKDDEKIVETQDGGGNEDVSYPAEFPPSKQQRVDGGADLKRRNISGHYSCELLTYKTDHC